MATTCCICELAEGYTLPDGAIIARATVRCVNEHAGWCCQFCHDARCRLEEFATARPPCAICFGRLYLDAAELEAVDNHMAYVLAHPDGPGREHLHTLRRLLKVDHHLEREQLEDGPPWGLMEELSAGPRTDGAIARRVVEMRRKNLQKKGGA
jgi:hypothetical protein